MFDIFCTDACQRRKFENFYDVRMTENKWKFLEDQRGERKMYCQDHVETQWTKTMTRRNNDLVALERMRHSVNAEQPMAVPESIETTEDTSDSADELYTPVTVEDVEFQSPRKKKKVMEDKNSNVSSSMLNLAKLKLTTLQILSAASGVDAKVLFERIDFVISDQTAHNIDVELLVLLKSLAQRKYLINCFAMFIHALCSIG